VEARVYPGGVRLNEIRANIDMQLASRVAAECGASRHLPAQRLRAKRHREAVPGVEPDNRIWQYQVAQGGDSDWPKAQGADIDAMLRR